MTARISMLILVTGLFVAAWSGDRPRGLHADGSSFPAKQSPYPDEGVKETVLHRWMQRTTSGDNELQANSIADYDADIEIADACQAVRTAKAIDAVSVRIDWLGIGAQLQEQYAHARHVSQTRPLWHRLTNSVARMLAYPQELENSSIAVQPGDAVRE